MLQKIIGGGQGERNNFIITRNFKIFLVKEPANLVVS